MGNNSISKEVRLVIGISSLLFILLAIILFLNVSDTSFSQVVVANIKAEDIESGKVILSYESFGAVGDGVTNDAVAIEAAHDLANKLYVEKNLLYTVQSCNSDDCSDKNYYIGELDKRINVTTDVDWKNAKFTIDDYVDADNNGINDINIKDSIFNITSPMYVDIGFSYFSLSSAIKTELSTSNKINPDTTNLKQLLNYIYDGKTNEHSKYSETLIKKSLQYVKSSQRIMVYVQDNNRIYKRYDLTGVNDDDGQYQSEMIILDTKTGDVLNDILYTYSNIRNIYIYPVPDKKTVIKNGTFTTKTNNQLYYNNVDNSDYTKSMTNRNILVSWTGNVEINNITHYLDESAHKYSSKYQTTDEGNVYGGFININNSSYINLSNLKLSPHTFYSNVVNGVAKGSMGTYDLLYESSVNIFIDNLTYSCLENKNCEYENMESKTKWGIMGGSTIKNLFITNSKVNRIDFHAGGHNVYIKNTTIGRYGLLLVGSGYLYGDNITLSTESENAAIKLREDYGASWNGTLVFDNLKWVLKDGTWNYSLISAINNGNHDYGYTSYFPNLYINDLTIDTKTNNFLLVDKINLLKFSNLYSNDKVTIDTSVTNNLYTFKDNIYVGKVNFIHYNDILPSINLFTSEFVSSAGPTTSKSSYGNSNYVDVFIPSSGITNNLGERTNDKFNIRNSSGNTNNPTVGVKSFFEDSKKGLIVSSKMPNALDTYVTEIKLSNGKVSEKIENGAYKYTATVEDRHLTINLKTNNSGAEIEWTEKKFTLKEGKNIITFSVSSPYGAIKKYELIVNKVVKNNSEKDTTNTKKEDKVDKKDEEVKKEDKEESKVDNSTLETDKKEEIEEQKKQNEQIIVIYDNKTADKNETNSLIVFLIMILIIAALLLIVRLIFYIINKNVIKGLK